MAMHIEGWEAVALEIDDPEPIDDDGRRSCVYCGERFKPEYSREAYCSTDCQVQYAVDRY